MDDQDELTMLIFEIIHEVAQKAQSEQAEDMLRSVEQRMRVAGLKGRR